MTHHVRCEPTGSIGRYISAVQLELIMLLLQCPCCVMYYRWRDHRDEPRLLPLLCELLLDARCTDAALWRSLLQRMVRRDGLYRPLLLRILPRLSHAGLLPLAQCNSSSTVTGSSGGVSDDSNSLAALWETVMRSPLQELLQHAERRTRSEVLKAKAAAAAVATDSAGAALSFSASLLFTAPSSTATTAAASNSSSDSSTQSVAKHSHTADSNSTIQGDCIGGKPAAAVVEALDKALYLLRCCPFAGTVDAAWFAAAYMTLGARFHTHAVSAALCVQSPQQRVSVLINECLSKGCSAVLLLDSIGDSGSSSSSSSGSVSTAAQAVYDAVDATDKHEELRSSSHFQSMVQHLVVIGKAQKLMQLCLSKQLLVEAEELAKLHYAVHATAGAATISSSSCLEQYCSEFGIAVPPQ
jgi:Mitochondrial 28S ribosomal protein S22